jgi:hypothetical protein
MKKSRFTTEQIIGLIKQADADMAEAELCRQPAQRQKAGTVDHRFALSI